MIRTLFTTASAVALLVVSGCAGKTNLTVGPKAALVDQSVPTPLKVSYSTVMVLPPKGSERGEVTELASLERALLKHGVRVISSGVTGRVVLENADAKKNEGAQSLSDLERALVLARKSNAEALLQVVELKWDTQADLDRYYMLGTGGFTELSAKPNSDWYKSNKNWQEHLWIVKGPCLNFEAKLIDVESGEIVTSILLAQSTVHEIEMQTVSIITKGTSLVPEGQHVSELATSELRTAVVGTVMDRLAELIVKGNPRPAVAKGPTPEEVALAAEKSKLEAERQKLEEEKKRLADDEARRQKDEEARKLAEREADAKGPGKKDAKKK